MRFARQMSVLSVLAVASALLAVPADAVRDRDARPRSRSATRAVVHGRDAGVSQRRPTSFEVFSRRGRTGSAEAAAPTSPAPRTPASVLGFDALADLDEAVPSDTTGAVGDSFFLTATNVRTALYDLAGTAVVAPTLLETLHPDSVGRFTFDPKVVYDQFTDTFLLVYLVQEDSPRLSVIVTVAIPNATASDQSTWCATAFAGDAVAGPPALWADYPTVGYNELRVTISTNQFTFPSSQGRFRHAQILSIPKETLYDCTTEPPVPDVFAGRQTRDPEGIQGFTLQPAQTVDTSVTSQLLVSVQLAGRDSYLALWRVKLTASGLVLKKGTVEIGRTTFPPPGTQGGGSLTSPETYWDAGDDRLTTAFYDGDSDQLFTAHAVLKNFRPDTITDGYPEAAVRWYEVDPATRLSNSTLVRKGTIGAPEVDVGWPSVATDELGNLFVTYSRASQPLGEFLSAWVAEILPGQTAATQVLMAPGLATYDAINGIERWGDYTAMNRDPAATGSLAAFNQYALDEDSWQQSVSVVRHG